MPPAHEGPAGMEAPTMHARVDQAEDLHTYDDLDDSVKDQAERSQDILKDKGMAKE